MLRHNYQEEAIQIINEIPQTKMKEVVEVLKKYKKGKPSKKNSNDFRKTSEKVWELFKDSKSSSYDFIKRKKIEKRLEL